MKVSTIDIFKMIAFVAIMLLLGHFASAQDVTIAHAVDKQEWQIKLNLWPDQDSLYLDKFECIEYAFEEFSRLVTAGQQKMDLSINGNPYKMQILYDPAVNFDVFQIINGQYLIFSVHFSLNNDYQAFATFREAETVLANYESLFD